MTPRSRSHWPAPCGGKATRSTSAPMAAPRSKVPTRTPTWSCSTSVCRTSTDLQPVDVRQTEVEHDQVGVLVGTFERGAAIGADVDLVAFPPQGTGQWLRDRGIILSKQNSGHERIVESIGAFSDQASGPVASRQRLL